MDVASTSRAGAQPDARIDAQEGRLNGLELPEISGEIWNAKYRFRDASGAPVDETRADTLKRVARAAGDAEPVRMRKRHVREFLAIMQDGRFLPGGRILAGAGTGREVTLFNCFVMDTLEDSLTGIFNAVRDSALTMQQGGGIGVDFSPIRPAGAPVASIGSDASGPVSFMAVWDAMCRTIKSAGARRGAMMATLRCDHPDIEAFIAAKAKPGELTNFNLSVLVTDAFMDAVEAGENWDLVFGGKVWRSVSARGLWNDILRATYERAEPGVIFIDRVNAANNLNYCETIHATNPCGEQPLPANGACLLGSLNLAAFVNDPFGAAAAMDTGKLAETVAPAVRLLDNVIDISQYPLRAQREEARAKRRIGLGVTGLADALVMCGLRYGTAQAAEAAGAWMRVIQNAAWKASAELAREKGAFPLFDARAYRDNAMLKRLDADVQACVREHGLRNALVTSIAPTGTISLFAGNVSSGIEPIFAPEYRRRVLGPDGEARTQTVVDHAVRLYRAIRGQGSARGEDGDGEDGDGEDGAGGAHALPDAFVSAQSLDPQAHIAMQAAMQPWVDSAISKTVNVPADMSFEAFGDVYAKAWSAGLKGCTTYRPNPVTGSVLSAGAEGAAREAGEADLHGRENERGSETLTAEPMARGPVLPGCTYKIRWPDSEHAIYITINDTLEGGRRRPFEIFINSKAMEHFAWTVALTRMISAVFRRGGDVRFVVEELKAVFDPRGGHWMEGRYVPSLLAAIGGVIEEHMRATGFLREGGAQEIVPQAKGAWAKVPPGPGATTAPAQVPRGRSCPRCGQPTLVHAEGCLQCTSCDYSRCQ